MKIDRATMTAAFGEHFRKYAGPGRSQPWELENHAKYWQVGRNAFDHGSDAAFDSLYGELRGKWQAFRGRGQEQWVAEKIRDEIRKLPVPFRSLRLRDLQDKHLAELWSLIYSLRELKVSDGVPSVVALSKFLHFWNPRLFVIVDRGVMWNYVFGHDWIWKPIEAERARLEKLIAGVDCSKANGACDLLSYIAVLRWSAGVLRDNPALAEEMAAYFRKHVGAPLVPHDLDNHDAVTIEWFLVGVVELPPPGVAPV